MSFGFSPSDVITLITLTTKAYRGWKSACGEYADITTQLDDLLILLDRIEAEASRPVSAIVRNAKDGHDLRDILSSCDSTVRELNAIITKFHSLGTNKSREKNWDRLRFGNKNLEGLRTKLIDHKTSLSTFLSAVGLSSLARIERDLSALPEQMRRIIDGLAVDIRAGRREGSIMTTYEDDEKDVWRQFRRELIGDGMRSSAIHKYKPRIRAYLRTLAEEGLLQEDGEEAAEYCLDRSRSQPLLEKPSQTQVEKWDAEPVRRVSESGTPPYGPATTMPYEVHRDGDRSDPGLDAISPDDLGLALCDDYNRGILIHSPASIPENEEAETGAPVLSGDGRAEENIISSANSKQPYAKEVRTESEAPAPAPCAEPEPSVTPPLGPQPPPLQQPEDDYYYERRPRERRRRSDSYDGDTDRYRRRGISSDSGTDDSYVNVRNHTRRVHKEDESPTLRRLATAAIAGIGAASIMANHLKNKNKNEPPREYSNDYVSDDSREYVPRRRKDPDNERANRNTQMAHAGLAAAAAAGLFERLRKNKSEDNGGRSQYV